jgi:hypothetical protein
MKKFKKLSGKQKERVVTEVKLMLTAHRDCLWNKWNACKEEERQSRQLSDPTRVSMECADGYYGEAFGVMRGLLVLGYGYFGPSNLDAVQDGRSITPEHNLKWWFENLVQEVLHEEGFPPGAAEVCLKRLEEYRQLVRK